MKKDVKFSKAMNDLLNLLFDRYGSDHPAIETIVDWFSDDENDMITDNDIEFAYKKCNDGMFYLIRDLMNWDFFWINEQGEIDIENANEPDIAKLVAPFVGKQLARRVRQSFSSL